MVLLLDVSCERDVTSETAGTSSFAATRGRTDFAREEVAETTWVKDEDLDRRLSKSGDSVSGKGWAYCGEEECKTDVRPLSLLQ